MGTYKRIAAVKISADILRLLSEQREPISGKDVSISIGIKYPTVMCHLATLEDERFVKRISGSDTFILGQDAALLWSRSKSKLQASRDKIDHQLEQLEIK